MPRWVGLDDGRIAQAHVLPSFFWLVVEFDRLYLPIDVIISGRHCVT